MQNGRKAGHFNESLAQKPSLTLAEVVVMVECYIKGEESNAEKKARGIRERVPNAESSHPSRKNNYSSPIKDKSMLKRVGEAMESFTHLNTRQKQI